MTLLSGKRTYIIATLMLVYGLGGLALGELETTEVGRIVLEGLALVGLRAGIAKA